MAQVWSLAWEISHGVDMAKKKKKAMLVTSHTKEFQVIYRDTALSSRQYINSACLKCEFFPKLNWWGGGNFTMKKSTNTVLNSIPGWECPYGTSTAIKIFKKKRETWWLDVTYNSGWDLGTEKDIRQKLRKPIQSLIMEHDNVRKKNAYMYV